MNSIKAVGKYLDQPILLKKIEKAVPAVLIVGGAAYAYKEIQKSAKEERNKKTIQNLSVLTLTAASALLAPKIASKIVKEEIPETIKSTKEVIENYLKNNKKIISENTKNILHKAREKVLSIKEIKTVSDELEKKKHGQIFLKELIPDPENVDSKHIFSEIGKLSILGLVPVLGGITGGIVGDKLTEKNWQKKIPDKIKEGCYQYFANIFLCNVGAAAALAIMEKKNVQSKALKAGAMIAGIIITGIVGGSTIANLIGNKIINPLFEKDHKHHKHGKKELFSERKPEAIDIGLHVDDIATVGVLSGLKWIEPALPILYSISGYRAGVGYRNGEGQHH